MDVALYTRVFWRYRRLLVSGLLLAVVLAFLAGTRVSLADGKPTFQPRGTEEWQSQSVLFITQLGFPWGRAVPQYTSPDPTSNIPPIPLGDQARLAGLSQIYSQLANSDNVLASIKRAAPITGKVKAEAGTDPSGQPLPLVTITATSTTAGGASRLAETASRTLDGYVSQQQDEASIPSADRIVLQVLDRGARAQLVTPRKKTIPLLVFFSVMFATIGLVFILENAGRGVGTLMQRDRVAA